MIDMTGELSPSVEPSVETSSVENCRIAERRMKSSNMLLLFLLFTFDQSVSAADATIDFNRDIRPILSDNCYACHGPDESHREGGFRLDRKDSAFAKAESEAVVIVPGKPQLSELITRIVTDDEDLRMPPADSTKSLTREQIELLKKWVAQGANWQEHWAFISPVTAPA